jgi:N-acetylglucosamine-6-sulfatase
MNNIYDGGTSIHGWSISRLVSRLDALLLTLKACKGKVCTRPWETLHPQDDVHNLADAMNTGFDEFYIEKQAKVTFSACMLGYLPAYEGALEPLPYHGGETLLAPHWSDWT